MPQGMKASYRMPPTLSISSAKMVPVSGTPKMPEKPEASEATSIV